MLIRKYIHSCLLLEHKRLLFDPGKFSFVEGRVTPETFGHVAMVILTHGHPDHLDVDALRQILARTGASVLSNGEVAEQLRGEGIEVTVLEEGTRRVGAFTLEAVPAPHEAILSDQLPRDTAFLVDGCVLNPGDSFAPRLDASAGVELLVLPVMAPFLTELAVAGFAWRMRPRQVPPVHDGYAKGFFLEQRYATYGQYFDRLGIRFHPMAEVGARVTL